MAGTKVENKNLKQEAYKILKQKIVSCEYPPGSMLNEAQLATELGFSRTPIREAISILEMDGFLKVVPKKGIMVTDILLNDVVQIFETRMEIEPLTLKLAGPNIPKQGLQEWKEKFLNSEGSTESGYEMDTGMHLFIIRHCYNSYLIEMMEKVFDKNTRVIIMSKQNQAHLKEALHEHLDILDCLIDSSYDVAASKMREHVAHCRNAAMEFFYST